MSNKKETAVTVIMPTYNAGEGFMNICCALDKQTANVKDVIIIDSNSSDSTVEIAKHFGFTVNSIKKEDFGHGKTRQYGVNLASTELIVFLTQDALLYDTLAIEKLITYLQSGEKVAAVYGRQLPYADTGELGAYARIRNYGSLSFVNTLMDRNRKGIKAAFLSDSFAAYKKSLLLTLGGFPNDVNFGEDMYVAAKFLLAGYKTGYCAEAKVYHSHNYSLAQDFRRCREIGRFHKEQHWLLEEFGKAEGEGIRYVFAEAKWLLGIGKWYLIPVAFFHNLAKYLGYKLA